MLPCNDCAYKRDIVGDAHFSCVFDWEKANEEIQNSYPSCSHTHALKWFIFPYNYDPVWGPDECPAQSDKLDPDMEKKHNPIESLISLMGKRLL